MPVTASATTQRTPEMLDALLGPIALYPDPLIALMLPASTTPSDMVLASRYLDAKNDPAATDAQPWSESVKALVHYPDVLKWMNDNLAWTQALGQAFLDQPTDVMNTVQRLRSRAKASGALVDTPQQHVLAQAGQIAIEPAQADIVYVPIYDPGVVYVHRDVWVNEPFITFGFGYPIGSWFIYDCDWGQSTVWVTSRPRDWRNHPQYWHRPPTNGRPLPGKPWRPPANNHPRPAHPANAHPPLPQPIRPNPSYPQTHLPAFVRPQEKNPTTTGAPDSKPPRPSTFSREQHRGMPSAPTMPPTVSPPAPAPQPPPPAVMPPVAAPQPPPAVIKPPTFAPPAASVKKENPERPHKASPPPPTTRGVVPTPPPAPPATPPTNDPGSQKTRGNP